MQGGEPVPVFLFSSLLVSKILTYRCVKFAVRDIKQFGSKICLRFMNIVS
jgi:hypothetical protein